MKATIDSHHAKLRYVSYIVGFVLSIITTLVAYFLVLNQVWEKEMLTYVVMGIAVVQLIVQLVFFLHLGRGNPWKLITFVSALLIVLIVVIGSLWIMHNLDYKMMTMTPEQMEQYMVENEGI